MAAPNEPFIVTLISPSGAAVGAARFFPTQAEAVDGAKDMIRVAPQGHSVYAYKAFAHIDMSVTYNTVID